MNNAYAEVARAFLKKNRVFRFHMKKIDDMDDREVVNACHVWYTENRLEKEYREFENQWFGWKSL